MRFLSIYQQNSMFYALKSESVALLHVTFQVSEPHSPWLTDLGCFYTTDKYRLLIISNI